LQHGFQFSSALADVRGGIVRRPAVF
jgi:hypothetical protein